MLSVPQAMRAVNFSSTQSTYPALQMRVRRLLSNPKFVADTPSPPTRHVNFSTPMPTVSTLSTPLVATASVATSTTTATETDEDKGTSSNITKPKLDGIRLTATGKAKDDANKKS
jgi:hypothetical protein